ncbi:MAG: hypothetical protein KAI24_26260 [Planctomycetes bacterium]|nr:hypothetical protein [Planctomycetota bacterium]
MPADDKQLPESLTERILAVPEGLFWSSDLLDVVTELVRLECSKRIRPRHVGLGGDSWNAESLQELACRCYARCVLGVDLDGESTAATATGFERLRIKARSEGVGVGYLRLAIRNHLKDLQRAQDPQAAAVFQRITRAVAHLLEKGEVHVVPVPPPLDKHSVVAFRPASDPVDPTELFALVASCPGSDALIHRLRRFGEEPTKEIWDLFGWIESSAHGAFKVGDLLDALARLAGQKVDLASEALDDVPAADGAGEEDTCLAARLDALLARMRAAIEADVCSQVMKQRMLALLEARWELVAMPDAPNLTLTSLAAACGMSKQRASEAWKRLEGLVAAEFGVNLADGIGNSPSVG